MSKNNIAHLIFLLAFIGANAQQIEKEQSTKIAFGSCAWEKKELSIFNNIVAHDPDYFIFLGDNIYGDTKNMDTLKAKYERLGSKSTFQHLKNNVPILATWDDHDYGWNDVGKEYEYKEASKEIFLNFFGESLSSTRRSHAGIYHSYEYNIDGNILQIILLDNRTFRDSLKAYDGAFDDDRRYSFYETDYGQHHSAEATFLGEEQWKWLEEQFQKPATIRIIGSGTQFGIEWNGYEAWANFPLEQKRMLELIKKYRVDGMLFITGDVHYSEISKLATDFYPIYDFTSSGLSSTWKFATPNKNRIEGPIMDNHFGLITINWSPNPEIKMETWDIHDNQRIEYSIHLADISFKKK